MIIDPDRNGCTVWMGNKFQILTGSIDECCERIIKFITRDISEESELYRRCFNFINFKKSKCTITGKEQWLFDVYLDTVGIGKAYADYFDHYGIIYEKVVPMKVL